VFRNTILTYPMEEIPSCEANRVSANQEIYLISWNPKVYYRIYNFPPHVPILNQLVLVHNPTSHFLKIHLIIIYLSTPGSPKWFLRFPHQNPVYPSPVSIRATCSAHLIPLDFITQKILGEEYKLLSSPLCSFLHYFVTLSLLVPNIFNKLISNTLSLRFSLNVSDQLSHPSKTAGKLLDLYVLIFLFLDWNWKTKDGATNDKKNSLT
jgi:hypothetical protein